MFSLRCTTAAPLSFCCTTAPPLPRHRRHHTFSPYVIATTPRPHRQPLPPITIERAEAESRSPPSTLANGGRAAHTAATRIKPRPATLCPPLLQMRPQGRLVELFDGTVTVARDHGPQPLIQFSHPYISTARVLHPGPPPPDCNGNTAARHPASKSMSPLSRPSSPPPTGLLGFIATTPPYPLANESKWVGTQCQ
ncbi:hypothetical protein BD779DRAFT_1671034 [Infundibulicybe gibba]|nr:hypothetical protein BD779DRAFT_1671034 [Infundibulicybe gibba]